MAGDWLKMRLDLAEDPAVIQIAAQTGIPEDTVVGKLHRLWSWASKHTADGHACGVTESWLDRYLDVTGFGEAMVSVGWLEVTCEGLTFPNWNRHNSKGAKERALATLRKERQRSGGGVTHLSRPERDTCHAPSVTESRPEKRREEKNKPPQPPLSGGEGKDDGKTEAQEEPSQPYSHPGWQPLPADRPELYPIAQRVVKYYQRTILPSHTERGGVQAVIPLLAVGIAEDTLRRCADGYANFCSTHGRSPQHRESVRTFYSGDGSWSEYQEYRKQPAQPPQAQPAKPAPPPKTVEPIQELAKMLRGSLGDLGADVPRKAPALPQDERRGGQSTEPPS